MNQDSRFILAQNIQKLRKKANLTREDLSLCLRFENSYISKIEKQKINITLDSLEKIANYFKIDTYVLLKP